MMNNKPIIIIGAGPAGLIASQAAIENGAKRVIVIDREPFAGGILNQCIHTGFGLAVFNEELTGPEFAARVYEKAKNGGVEFWHNTTVLSLSKDKVVTTVSPERGVEKIAAGAVILCTGCRERARGVIHIPGERPTGIYTAGLAQKFVNIDGYLPGKNFVILGSGDIGLIMARRLTLQGAKVKAVLEVQNFCGGLSRNVIQCLDDFEIPLYLSHTITDIKGKSRVEQITAAKVDETFKPIKGTEFNIDCDAVLLSVGLIPENEIAESCGVKLNPATNGTLVDENFMTSVDGVFACGNALHVHDLVDKLALEAKEVGINAVQYANGELIALAKTDVSYDNNFGYVLPHKVSGEKKVKFSFRVRKPMENVVINVGEFSKKIKFLQPNEMASVTVPPEHLKTEKVKICLTN